MTIKQGLSCIIIYYIAGTERQHCTLMFAAIANGAKFEYRTNTFLINIQCMQSFPDWKKLQKNVLQKSNLCFLCDHFINTFLRSSDNNSIWLTEKLGHPVFISCSTDSPCTTARIRGPISNYNRGWVHILWHIFPTTTLILFILMIYCCVQNIFAFFITQMW